MEFNNYEFAIEQKIKGKLLLKAIMLVLLYITYTVVTFSVLVIFRIIPFGALIPVTLSILVFFTWRYVKIDNRYVVESGVMKLFVKYGSASPKEVTSFRIKDALEIAPKGTKADFAIEKFSPKHVYNALPFETCDGAYYALYKNSNGENCVLYFKATDEALKILSFYNSSVKK